MFFIAVWFAQLAATVACGLSLFGDVAAAGQAMHAIVLCISRCTGCSTACWNETELQMRSRIYRGRIPN
jgi:hypothetical protein